jgi:hypothetical protein
LSQGPEAERKKAYCLGFLYAVITKLEMDGKVCLGPLGDIGLAIDESSRILRDSSQGEFAGKRDSRGRQLAWVVLEKGLSDSLCCE